MNRGTIADQLLYYFFSWIVAALVLATLTAAGIALGTKKWSWKIWLLSAFAWVVGFSLFFLLTVF
jgi:hypothetical protein